MVRDVVLALYPLNSSRRLPHPDFADAEPGRAMPSDDDRARARELRALVGPRPSAPLGRLALRYAGAIADGRLGIDDAGQQQFEALLRELRVAWRAHTVRQRLALFVEPAATPGHAVVFGIAFGEIVGRAEVDVDNWPASVDRILRAVAVARAAPASSPLDPEALIIDQRLRDRGPLGTLELGPDIDVDRALTGVAPLIERACVHRRPSAAAPPVPTPLDA